MVQDAREAAQHSGYRVGFVFRQTQVYSSVKWVVPGLSHRTVGKTL